MGVLTTFHTAGGWQRFFSPALLVSTIAAWLSLSFWHAFVPLPVLILAGGFVVCLHSSLQHEAVHGHFGQHVFTRLLLSLSLSLWIPYDVYKSQHLRHHGCARFTDPLDDPESFYFTRAQWQEKNAVSRWLYEVNQTLIGRLIIGPWLILPTFLKSQLALIRSDELGLRNAWLVHILLLLTIMLWLLVCDMSALTYVLCFAWPGTSLMLLRSYYEHKASNTKDTGCVIIEACPLTRLLYLNNNYHLLHHRRPELAWYELRKNYAESRDELTTANHGFYFQSYWTLFKQYAFIRKDSPVVD